MDEPRGHYAKWNKSDAERQTLYDIAYIWYELTETESGMVVASGWRAGEMGRCWSKGTNFQL